MRAIIMSIFTGVDVNAVSDELLALPTVIPISNVADIDSHELQDKVTIIIYPRLTKYMVVNAYIPFRYKGLRIVMLNKHANDNEYGALVDFARSILC